MKKKFTTAAVAASMVGGIAIGSVIAPPMSAFAADNSTSATAAATARTPAKWITDSLKGLVDNGTLTQAQSDKVASALESAEPKGGPGGPGRHGVGGPAEVKAAATVLGLSESDLRTEMQTKSLADIAKEKNIDAQKVIDALVANENARIDKEVTDGKLTQAKADERKADVTKRVTEMVNRVEPKRDDKVPAPDGNAPTPPSDAGSASTPDVATPAA